MTQTLKNTVLLLLVASGFGLLALVLVPAPGSAASAGVAAPTMHRIDVIPAQIQAHGTGVGGDLALLDAAQPQDGEALTAAQAQEVLLAADRVCEGFAAQVPLTTMEQTLTAQEGIAAGQAHDFVALVLDTHCGAAVTP